MIPGHQREFVAADVVGIHNQSELDFYELEICRSDFGIYQ